MSATLQRLSRRAAINLLLDAYFRQRPTIVPLDNAVAVKLPWKQWQEVVVALQAMR